MKKLKFPIIKGRVPDTKWLSMDDYLKFVDFNMRYTVDRESNRKWKKRLAVNVPFSI